MIFKEFLEKYPEQHHADEENPADWVFTDWMESKKLRNSSSRLENPDDDNTWEGVPQVSFPNAFRCLANSLKEYRDVYIQGVNLITAISSEIAKQSTSGASGAENAMLMAVRELTAEVRALREAYMVVVSLFQAPLSLLNTDFVTA